MNRQHWFTTPIWHEYFTLSTKEIVDTCLSLRENNYPNREYTNKGGWQSQDIFGVFPDLENVINQSVSKIAKEIDDNLQLALENIWININEKTHYNAEHTHPMTALSGTIYIQVDDRTGDIRFFDRVFTIKHYPLNLDVSNKLFHHTVTYKPVNGMMLIFPAWVSHDVTPSESDLTRISIAFNIKQI